MRYLQKRWEEARGDEYADWGFSIWFLEVDDELNVLRQLEIYDSGVALKYSEVHLEDEYGCLADQPLDAEDWSAYEISQGAFNESWNSAQALNERTK